MLIGPWALTTAGAATVETAPAAATFKKRRRVVVLCLVGVVMVSLPVFEVDPWWMASCFIGKDKGSRGRLASMFRMMRRFDAAGIPAR
jgi:hypothetical protein